MGVIVYHCKPGKSDSLRGEEILKLHTLLLKSYPQTTTVCFAAESGFYFLWKKKKTFSWGGLTATSLKTIIKIHLLFMLCKLKTKFQNIWRSSAIKISLIRVRKVGCMQLFMIKKINLCTRCKKKKSEIPVHLFFSHM